MWSHRSDFSFSGRSRRHVSNIRGTRAHENAHTEAARRRRLDGSDSGRRRRRPPRSRPPARPRSRSGPQTWRVGGVPCSGTRRATAASASVVGGPGAAFSPGTLSDQSPLDITTDYGPGTFNAYGLARDGVVAVEIRIGGASRPAAFRHNAFTFWDASLGETEPGSAAVVRDDGRRNDALGGVPRRAWTPNRLPGMMPGATARRPEGPFFFFFFFFFFAVRAPVRRSGGAGPGRLTPFFLSSPPRRGSARA